MREPNGNRVLTRAGLCLGLALGLIGGAAAPAAAQEGAEAPVASAPDSLELVDRVVAIVGDTAILLSELRQEFIRLEAQGVQLPPAGSEGREALGQRLLSAMIDRYLLLQQAKRSDISLSDDEVEQVTEQRFQEVRQNFPSQEAFQEAVERSGQNMFQYRQALRAEARAEILLDRFRRQVQRSGQLAPSRVSEEEIVAYFEENAAGETRPASVSFHRLAVVPLPSEAAEDSAMARAQRALDEIRAGEPFEVVARRYSEDPGSREQGGELGWLRRNEVVPAFADVAWLARPGVAVGPVRTRFGWHVIRVENVRGGERNLRHILIRPEIGEEERAAAREFAEALADSLRAGADARDLAQAHSTVIEEDVVFEDVPVSELGQRFGAEVRQRLEGTLPGDVVGPFETRGDAGVPNFVVLEMIRYRAPGPYELDDVRESIRERLRAEKQLERYLEELRRQTYVQLLM